LGIIGISRSRHRLSSLSGKCREERFSILSAVHAANFLEHEQNDRDGSHVGAMLDMEYLEKLGCADRVDIWRRICADSMDEEAADDSEGTLC